MAEKVATDFLEENTPTSEVCVRNVVLVRTGAIGIDIERWRRSRRMEGAQMQTRKLVDNRSYAQRRQMKNEEEEGCVVDMQSS